MFFSIHVNNAVMTYVGVKIINLTDDPSASCIGYFNSSVDPYQQGRIRAISSVQPDYPIYFNLTYANNATQVWAGNDTADSDYTIGDTIYLPQAIDMQVGVDYNLFMDIDAIRFYLPLASYSSFEKTLDNNYWTAGIVGDKNSIYEYTYTSTNICTINNMNNYATTTDVFLSNNRSLLNHSSIYDYTKNNAYHYGFMAIITGAYNFNGTTHYINFSKANIGNINFVFTFN